MVNEIFNIRYKVKMQKIGTSYFLRVPRELVVSNNLENKELIVRLIIEEVIGEKNRETKEVV